MNETLNLTLITNGMTLLALGGIVWTGLLLWTVAAIHSVGYKTEDGLNQLSRSVSLKDFSFKPKFNENNGALQVSEYRYAPMFAPRLNWMETQTL